MGIQTTTVEYTHEETVLEAYLAFDDSHNTPRPTVLIAHAWEGRNSFVCEKAKKLAGLGYTAFALDVYGKGVLGSTPEENNALMQPLLNDRVALQQRLAAGYHAAASQSQVDSDKIAVMGYCFGGLCALDMARTNTQLTAAVSFHGLLTAPGNTGTNVINAKILILHGHKDPLVPIEQVVACQQELTNAGADWQIHTYGNAQHSFTNPQATDTRSGLLYDTDADRRSWQALLNFLNEVF